MPAMTNLLVKDDTVTTPVEFTLLPIKDAPENQWRTSTAGVPLESQMRATLSDTPTKGGGVKMTLKLEVSVLETLGASGTSSGYVAPPKTAYATVFIATMFSDRRATNQNRADCLKMAIGLLQGASSTTATGVLANTAAGNAFVNSVLPVPYAFVNAIRPT